MKAFHVLALVICWQLGPQFAWAKPEDEIRAVLEQNFAATSGEDLKTLMGTLDRQLPRRDEFEQEARSVFADTDLYMRVQEFELLAVRGPWAQARVVQLTMPKDDPEGLGTPNQKFYRRNSMLLPESQLVEYTQMFHKTNGKWRLWLVTTKPQPVLPDIVTTDGRVMHGPSASRSVFGGDCANGRCRVK